ncbi:hypothetical protein LPB86_15755 [Pedobacter sp. MC2016-14]|uniref:MauE/DoxX family redox-associated membrane protein n=1 Tax=Pedobacter sp. MC2016-14 TaxID=2897327 RepID=UPI001E55FACE|nr:MauE/DoxX family redox-associated membrane protein [Pedobacter sp. MC2016-14]MCD0489697.1 hypothetical protein [Pedobacter sp. MC2016-14]
METILQKPLFRLSEKTKDLIVDIIIYIFLALFIYTAASKFQTQDGFEKILRRSPLTGSYSSFISWSVPISETIISFLLLIPSTKRIGLYASLAIMVIFTCFLIYGILVGSRLPCHCGGVISSLSWKQHIWFNLLFIAAAITGIKLKYNKDFTRVKQGKP